MALVATRVIVGTGAGTLVTSNTQTWGEGSGRRQVERVLLHCGTYTAGTYYIDGGTAVSTATGFPLVLTAGAAPVALDLDPGEAAYVIGVSTGTFAVLARGN